MHNTISRRQFLAATGAITGTALLNPLTGMKAEAANVMAPKASKKLRLADRHTWNDDVGAGFDEGLPGLYEVCRAL